MEITREDLARIIGVLKRTTVVVKLMPFIYAILYIAGILTYSFCSEPIVAWVDMICYMSPISVLFALTLSKCLKLCKWHRLECMLPLIGFLAIIINEFIVEFDKYGQLANYLIAISVFVASIINAYFVFIKPKR